MRTTVSIDDDVYNSAIEYLDPGIEKKELFREAIRVFIEVQAANRLAEMGGKLKDIKAVPRRRNDAYFG